MSRLTAVWPYVSGPVHTHWTRGRLGRLLGVAADVAAARRGLVEGVQRGIGAGNAWRSRLGGSMLPSRSIWRSSRPLTRSYR